MPNCFTGEKVKGTLTAFKNVDILASIPGVGPSVPTWKQQFYSMRNHTAVILQQMEPSAVLKYMCQDSKHKDSSVVLWQEKHLA